MVFASLAAITAAAAVSKIAATINIASSVATTVAAVNKLKNKERK